MIGNLEPEEHVMDQSIRYPGKMLGELAIALEKLGWEYGDDVSVEIGGAAVTGTATNPEANPKWAKPFGTVTYQKDAFIVIKNRTRSPFEPSKYNPDLKAHHAEP
jgi:hypothetical protein